MGGQPCKENNTLYPQNSLDKMYHQQQNIFAFYLASCDSRKEVNHGENNEKKSNYREGVEESDSAMSYQGYTSSAHLEQLVK